MFVYHSLQLQKLLSSTSPIFEAQHLSKILQSNFKIFNVDINKEKSLLLGFRNNGIQDFIKLQVITPDENQEYYEKNGYVVNLEDKTLTFKYVLNESKFNDKWEELRTYRNKLLADTDFINFVEIENKSEIEAYRQLLRDILNIYKNDPPEIILSKFPKCPKIIKSKIEEEEVLTEEEYETLLNNSSTNNLNLWETFKFTKNKAIVNNIFKIS